MDNINFSDLERQIMDDYLILCFYLKKVACKEKDEVRKRIISEKSNQLLTILSDPDSPLSGYSNDKKATLEKAAKECADFF
ncbi:MAG: hypothetical protein GY874_08240 [Desulfobacteraceae bacterium]|nr:hypothetical protein [Desulfobacteraceae bacterium]